MKSIDNVMSKYIGDLNEAKIDFWPYTFYIDILKKYGKLGKQGTKWIGKSKNFGDMAVLEVSVDGAMVPVNVSLYGHNKKDSPEKITFGFTPVDKQYISPIWKKTQSVLSSLLSNKYFTPEQRGQDFRAIFKMALVDYIGITDKEHFPKEYIDLFIFSLGSYFKKMPGSYAEVRSEIDETNKIAVLDIRSFSTEIYKSRPGEEDDDWPDFVGEKLIDKVIKEKLKTYRLEKTKYWVETSEKSWFTIHFDFK